MKDIEIKKYIKQVQDDSDKRMTRYMSALTENFDDKIQVVAEMVAHNTEKIDTLTDQVVQNTESINSIQGNIAIIQSDIGSIKTDLKKKVDYGEFVSLDRRIVLLEPKSKK